MNRKTILPPSGFSAEKTSVEHAMQGITLIPNQHPMDGLAFRKVNTFANYP